MTHYYPFRGEPPLTAKQRIRNRRYAIKAAAVRRHRNYSLDYGTRLRIWKKKPLLMYWQWPDRTDYRPSRRFSFHQWKPSLAMQRLYNTSVPF